MQVSLCIVPFAVVDNPGCADLSNWSLIRQGWNLAHEEWQEFSMKWCEIDNSVFRPDSKVLNFDMPDQHPCCMLICDCYVKAEEVVWQRATNQPLTGVILSGQLGIGTNIQSLFLYTPPELCSLYSQERHFSSGTSSSIS